MLSKTCKTPEQFKGIASLFENISLQFFFCMKYLARSIRDLHVTGIPESLPSPRKRGSYQGPPSLHHFKPEDLIERETSQPRSLEGLS